MPGLAEPVTGGSAWCRVAATSLPGLLDDHAADPALMAHIHGCLRCQAELAQYRRLRRAMAGLRDVVLDPGAGLVVDILAAAMRSPGSDVADGPDSRVAPGWRRGACLGGAALATAAGLVWASRRRLSAAG